MSKEQLDKIPAPVGSTTFRPVKHGDLVNALGTHLRNRGLVIRREEYAVQNQGSLLFGVIDFARKESDFHTASLGLRTSNDRRFALHIVAVGRVIVCDNLLLAGSSIVIKRRHVRRLDLDLELTHGLDRYQDSVHALNRHIDVLRNTPLTDSQGKELLFDLFKAGVCPIRLFHPITSEYFKAPEPRTLWTFHNACTTHFQQLMPGPKFTSTVALGKFIGLDGQSPSVC